MWWFSKTWLNVVLGTHSFKNTQAHLTLKVESKIIYFESASEHKAISSATWSIISWAWSMVKLMSLGKLVLI